MARTKKTYNTENKSETIAVRFTKEVIEQVVEKADTMNMNMSEFIRMCVEEMVKK